MPFMEQDKTYSKYYDEVVILLETGLRISEFCGLTVHIDMANRIINVDHQLLKDTEIGYYIETPKTKKGERQLPMTERAYQAFKRVLQNRGKAEPIIIGGYSNFLFLNQKGFPKVAGNYESMLRGLVKNTTRHIKTSYQISHRTHSDILLHEHGKQRNEPEHPAIHHGTFKHHHDIRVLRTRYFQFSESGT